MTTNTASPRIRAAEEENDRLRRHLRALAGAATTAADYRPTVDPLELIDDAVLDHDPALTSGPAVEHLDGVERENDGLRSALRMVAAGMLAVAEHESSAEVVA